MTHELPGSDELPSALIDLGVPFEDVNRLVALHGRLAADRELRSAFEHAVAAQAAVIGTHHLPSGLPVTWPDGVSEADGRRLTVLLFVALAPHTRAYHEARGIPSTVSRQTLADLGRQLAVGRRRGTVGGLGTGSWLTLHFRGELYQLGRLQFQRRHLRKKAAEAARAAGFGAWSLELHVPDFHGPLDPASCDRSLALAREFFARHWPDEPYDTASISSWLLDPQLARYLPPDSNILRFQQRFTFLDGGPDEPDDAEPLRYVFGDPDRPVESLPRDTSVQRAVVDHLRAGGHWYVVSGWFPLSSDR
ncbi:acyltransferase domain-containing protein [Kitasatospora sp. NPDC054939]